MLVLANIFQPLIDFFEAILKFFHNTVGVGWGMSIILMTVVIRAALVPLTLKQMHSMQRMQQLQPQIKALQAKYKDDKQRMQQEMMKFYKENQVNPFSSCLPMVLQLPVFISLFFMLRHDLRKNICPDVQTLAHTVHHVPLSKTVPCSAYGANDPHAHFLFIHDLTDKATGTTLIVLIVLYIASQLGSSLMMTTTMDKMQRNLMLFLPLIFVTFVIRFPAGLIVYWITTNLWTVLQQYFVKKRVGPLVPATAMAAAGGGGGGGSGGGPGSGRWGGRGGRRGGDEGGDLAPTPAAKAPSAKGKTTSNGASAEDRRSAKPPPPPRKKKKRSGRRR
ncbi:MAG: YidC/Oxa1 family rane protein insertase [Solirubrobacterales bacterium]|nr:YidC/Oxa1 family rane protein insertase [Solirubrobacterales bacterium]